MRIAMLGQKHTFSREGGIEVVVNELSTRMVANGHQVVCYDRKTNHVNGVDLDNPFDTKGVKVIPVWSIDKKGIAAFTSSISATWRASRSKADVVHIHAEGPAAMAWLPKLFHKRVICTIHGECEIIGSTGEKPVKSRLHGAPVFYPNSNTEGSIHSISYSGGLSGLYAMPVAIQQYMRRVLSILNPWENIRHLCGCVVC